MGAVERGNVLTGTDIAPGDVILGLASSGIHSNGFSLVRRIIADHRWDLDERLPSDAGHTIAEVLLEPTRIYVRSLLPLVQERQIKGLAHITGGGLLENIPRVLPEGCHAVVESGRWTLPPIFVELQQAGHIAPEEMARTFNCGVGMVIIVGADEVSGVTARLAASGETVFEIGGIEAGPRGCTVKGAAGSWKSPKDWSATHNA